MPSRASVLMAASAMRARRDIGHPPLTYQVSTTVECLYKCRGSGSGCLMKAVVIGGGIAGLASALALTSRGWQVEVFERAPEFTEIGAGLSLWPNALRALDALGVGDMVRGQAVLQGAVGIRDPAGRWLSRTDTADLERRFGLTAMIHRADLLAVLRAAAPDGVLRPGTQVRTVRSDGTVTHSGGESKADLVVG